MIKGNPIFLVSEPKQPVEGNREAFGNDIIFELLSYLLERMSNFGEV